MNDLFYVYLYRDNKSGAVKYIGRGAKITRASVHQLKSHNKDLESWLRKASFKLEIAGPFDSEDMSKAVEAALISSHSPTFNKRQESSKFVFRPVGVPEKYIARLQKNKLTREDLFKGKTNKILLVRITEQDFEDRVGYNQVSPPDDEAIVDRVQRYWQLGGEKFLEKWVVDKDESPTLLLGISGSPGSQIIIASLEIDTKQWSNVTVLKNNLISVPVASNTRLDKYGLRGYRLDKTADISFGSFKSKQFIIIEK